MKINLLLFSLFWTFLISCVKENEVVVENPIIEKYEFNQFQIDNYNIYHVGDTLLFKSIKSNVLRRFVISKKDSLNNSNSYSNSSTVYYLDLDLDYNSRFDLELVSFASNKFGQILGVSFDSFFDTYDKFEGINTIDTITSFNNKFIDYYELTDTVYKSSYREVVKIYWQKEKGIVKYDLNNGDSFIKVNF